MAEPPPLGPMLTPDGITDMAVAVASSLVAAWHEGIRGWGILVTNISAALLADIASPILTEHGYTYGNWRGIILVACGAAAYTVFAMIVLILRRIKAHGDEIGDGVAGWIVRKIKALLP